MAGRKLSSKEREELLGKLRARFEKNMNRHKGVSWGEVQARLESQAEKLWSLNEMERSGGEPDVVGQDKKTGEFIFQDCSAESPNGRRSVCYDTQKHARTADRKTALPQVPEYREVLRSAVRACFCVS